MLISCDISKDLLYFMYEKMSLDMPSLKNYNLSQLPVLVMVDARMEEDVLRVVDVNVNMDIKGKDVTCQERWVQTTM